MDEKLIGLSKTLFDIKSNLDLHKTISINRTAINAIGWGKIFFVHVQRMSLNLYILGICKVFEEEKKKYELNSLPSILKTAKDCTPQNEQPLMDFINEHKNLLGQGKEDCGNPPIADIEKICKEFYQKYIKDNKLEIVRHKIIAHSEYMEEATRPKDIESYDLLEKFLFFAIDMYSAINRAYISVPHPLKDERRANSSMCDVLGKLGVNNIKTKFEDE